MRVPTFPCHLYDENQRRTFDEAIRRLRNALDERLVPRPARGSNVKKDKQFLPSGKALEYFRACNNAKTEIKELYVLTAVSIVPSPPKSNVCGTLQNGEVGEGVVAPIAGEDDTRCKDLGDLEEAETFWQAVVGEDIQDRDPENARANLLAVLIFSNVTIQSEAWHNFFYRIKLPADAEGERFCDKMLRFKTREEVKATFGYNQDPMNASISNSIFLEQYLVCALVIDRKEITIHEEAHLLRLPYLEEEPLKCGKVCRVKFAPENCFCRSTSGFLVRKIVERNTSDTWMLRQLARNDEISRNIVDVQAIIHFPRETHIFMELAEGDLGELLLKSNDLHPVMFQDKIRLFKKLLGLAKGLELLHERISDPDSDSDCKMVGVHVDFRPQNILIVKDDYGDIIFKITDFGISFLGRGSSEGASFTNPRQGGDCDCRPPEGWSKILRVTTAYDVFAFGAVLCMCLAWLWGGKEEYEKFDAQRFNTLSQELNVYPNSWFFTVHPDSTYAREEMALVESKKLHLKLNTSERGDAVVIQLNERVVEYFKAIRDGDDQSDESAFIWEAFSILETHCLVPNPEQRSAMGKVHDLLNKLVERYARH